MRSRSFLTYAVMAVLAILFALPLVFLVWSSVTGPRAGANSFGFDNYSRVFAYGQGLLTYGKNTLLLAGGTVVLTVAVSTLGGYAFARLPFRGRNVLFAITLAILMVPYASLVLPLYVVLGWYQLLDSIFGVALVMTMLQLPFSLFMMRNSFSSLPRELEEAALVDGCTFGGAFRRVLLPGVIPGVVTVALYSFLAGWNEFIAPLVFLTDSSKLTLPVALVAQRSGSLGAIDFGALQAGVVFSAIPCVLLFLLLQRYYVKGFAAGALKG